MVSLAIYSVPGRRGILGLKVAVVPVQVTRPGTWIDPDDVSRVKVVTLIVSGSITSLNVTLMSVLVLTSVALSTGLSGTHFRFGGVRRYTDFKTPGLGSSQCVVGHIPGRGRNGGCMKAECERGRRRKDRNVVYDIISDCSCNGSARPGQRKCPRVGDSVRDHRLIKGGEDLSVGRHICGVISRYCGCDRGRGIVTWAWEEVFDHRLRIRPENRPEIIPSNIPLKYFSWCCLLF